MQETNQDRESMVRKKRVEKANRRLLIHHVSCALCDTYLKFTKDNYTLKVLRKQPKGEIFMKNWDVTLAQIPLVAVGAWYVYMAIDSFFWSRSNFQPQSGFIFGMIIGVVLIGIALALQEVRRYRANKSFINVPNTFPRSLLPNQKQQTVPEDTVVVAICPECKNRIPSTTKFCPECGTDLRPQDK